MPGQKLERGHLLRRPFTFDNCLVGIFLMGSDPVTLPYPTLPCHLPIFLFFPCSLTQCSSSRFCTLVFFMAFEWISPRQRTNWRHALRLCQDDNVKDFTRFAQRQRKFRLGFFHFKRGYGVCGKAFACFAWVSLILKTDSVRMISFDLEGVTHFSQEL